MSHLTANVPVHESLSVNEVTELYQNDEWWKAVVTYQFEDSDTEETAIYLWHEDDDGWTRKNKYVVKTAEAWATDREVIDRYIRSDPPTDETTEFPVSDYYTVGAGETAFKDDEWWKAIVNVVEKGSYETNEVMVYVWQRQDGEWRRRQKYTVKRVSDWEAEQEAIENHLSMGGGDGGSRQPGAPDDSETDELDAPDDGGELAAIRGEFDAHLSGEFADDD